MKQKYKELLKNTGFLTLSNFGSKILIFFLIPIYTNVLTTDEYGLYDLIVTTVSLCIPIFTLNIQESIIRFCLDETKSDNEVLKIGLKYNFFSFIVIILICLLCFFTGFFKISKIYLIFFCLMFISESLYYSFMKYARGIGEIRKSALAGVINTFFIIIFNICFLCWFKFGVYGYFVATILSYFIATCYIIISLRKKIFILNDKNINTNTKKEMLRYSIPLIFDNISWWIINVSDRYIITYILGVAANGIYSIAYKIPSVLNVFQSIFNQAWTISAVKENDNDSKLFYSNIYNLYNISMVFVCSFLICFDKFIAKILFAKEFYSAWMYAPFLMIAVVFGALSGLLGGVFNAMKDSKTLSITTIVGALINIILNIILVYKIGIIGAAVSTLIAYIVVWSIRLSNLVKKDKISINIKQHIFSYLLLLLQSICIIFIKKALILYFAQVVIIILIFILNINDFRKIISKFKKGLIKGDKK